MRQSLLTQLMQICELKNAALHKCRKWCIMDLRGGFAPVRRRLFPLNRKLFSALTLLFSLVLAFSTPAAAAPLPRTAALAGDYIPADAGKGGVEELSSYLYASSVLTAAQYTESSRSKLLLYSTSFTSPIIGRGSFGSYYQELTQVAPYVFVDMAGHVITFRVDENGRPTGLDFEGTEYVPMKLSRSPTFINLTLGFLQYLALYALAALAIWAAYAWSARRRMWRSYTATKLHTALLILMTLTVWNTLFLLVDAASLSFSYASRVPMMIANAVLAALTGLDCLLIAAFAPRGELLRRQKIFYFINIAHAAVLVFLVFYWQLFR
mgnify:FL=1